MTANEPVTEVTPGGGQQDTEPSPDRSEKPPEQLSLDEVFELLKNSRRRHTLRHLRENDRIELGELAEHVAAIENDTSPQGVTSDQRKRAYVGLYQCHLPKMDEMGAIDFDRDRGVIERGPNADQLERFLDPRSEVDRWPLYYLGAAGGGLVAILAALVGVPGIALSPAGVVATLSLAVVAVVHYHRTRPAAH